MSNTFKTQKGTELPLLDLKGKPYLQPAHRLIWFREEHPDWSILSTVEMFCEGFVKAEVKIIDDKGVERSRASSVYKFEENASEGAETGAMGRALAWLGFGTQFTTDDSSEHRPVVDSPIKPGVKPSQAPPKQEARPNPFKNHAQPKASSISAMTPIKSDYVVDFGKFKGKTLAEITKPVAEDYVLWLTTCAEKDKKPLNANSARFVEEVNKVWPISYPPKLDESEEVPF